MTNYIETVLRKDLGWGSTDRTVQVIAPPDIRNYLPISPNPGESEAEAAAVETAIDQLLDNAGYKKK